VDGLIRPKSKRASLTCLVACLIFGSPALAADPVPFDTISSKCLIGSGQGYGTSEWSTGVQQTGRDALLVSGQFSSGEGQFTVGEKMAIGGFGGPDTAWILDTGFYFPPSEPGKMIRGDVSCFKGDTNYTINLFDPPFAPTSFSGRATPSEEFNTTSTVAFRARQSGKYQAEVYVTTGVARVDRKAPPISGSKTISLGFVEADELRWIDVEAIGLSQATWELFVSRFVDVIAPSTKIIRAPARRTTKRRPWFRFRANERADFECRMNGGRFKPCASPYVPKRLRFGLHRFFVRATDAAGNVERPPASHRFRIVRRR